MYKKLAIIIFLTLVSLEFMQAQEPAFGRYRDIDRHVKKTPDSLSRNIVLLHNYLVAPAKNDEDKIRAFYLWIISNIEYKDQVELLFDPNLFFYMGSNNCSSPVCVLQKGKAVCEGFSRLFEFFCTYSGFESYSIGGYITKNGALQDRATHSWNVVKINNGWRFFDLSWANAILYHSGIKSKINEYFMVPPEEFILSHLPIIPMWQFLENPISLQIFNLGEESIKNYLKTAPANYNHADTLTNFKQLSATKKSLKTAQEIYRTNPNNKFNLAIEYYRYARNMLSFDGEIDTLNYFRLIKAKEKMQLAIDLFTSSSDISAQIMLLQIKADLSKVDKLINSASSDIKYLK
ncbi:transglutaminase domain-containing protein [Labilibaculum sp. K2S]|uniref:transglutaminase domain-containing protein n=1 Tax=Labilibaculum sp. K2S TaxID=3056386 RepID=UPI0025A43B2D|nr:transglutaminase domain-containing protein [Labilibaculum sp. K2S]MDM8158886.1 transglutaminase domain-containing protein [Labilibaculum sp. K2S]